MPSDRAESPARNIETTSLLGKQRINAPELIKPTGIFSESVGFHRVHGHIPIRLLQFNESLREPHRVLEEDVVVDHAVANEQRGRQTLGMLDGG